MTNPAALVLGASVPGGTGWMTAEALAARDCIVAVGARRAGPARQLAERIGGHAFACDATIEAEVATLAEAAADAMGGALDIAVLAAGEGVGGTIDTISPAELDRATTLNYTAGIYFIRHAARHMPRGGSIVLMSSIAADNPWPGYFAYGCAKAALQTLVRYAALEYAARGIRVNAVCPGPVEAVATAPAMPAPVQALIRDATPLGRRVTPREIAEAVSWLSLGATATTGEILHLDGGMHLGRPPYPAEIKAALAGTVKPAA